MIELLSEDVWRGLAAENLPRPITAAVAYVGRNANEVLSLEAGDRLVCDGSDANVRSGVISPDSLRHFVDRGVECWSLPGLHAKVILAGAERRQAVVGSANLSRRSRDVLGEAALRTDDPGVVAALEEQLAYWITQAVRVDQRWLDRATALYRPPHATGPGRATPQPPRGARMWLTHAEDVDERPSRAARDAQATTWGSLQRGFDTVEIFRLAPGDADLVRRGDVMIRAVTKPDAPHPHGARKVEPWAVVSDVVRGRRLGPSEAILVSRWTEGRHRPSVKEVREAVATTGQQVDWDAKTPWEPGDVTDAVWALFATESGPA